MSQSLDTLPDDPVVLKALIAKQHEEIARLAASKRAFEALVQALKIRIAKLQRQKFGPSSEKIEREIDQLQLALEDLEVATAASDAKRSCAASTSHPRSQSSWDPITRGRKACRYSRS